MSKAKRDCQTTIKDLLGERTFLFVLRSCVMIAVSFSLSCAAKNLSPELPGPTVSARPALRANNAQSTRWTQLANRADAIAYREITQLYSRAVDTKFGGFYSNFSSAYTLGDSPELSTVFQARMTWTAAEVSLRRPALRSDYSAYTRHGAAILVERLMEPSGRVRWKVSRDPAQENLNEAFNKDADTHIDGQVLAINALANAYRATGQAQTLQAAKEAFLWLDNSAHDTTNGGYFEVISSNGTPVLTNDQSPSKAYSDQIGKPLGVKSSNTHIHLLEAMTTLYEVWPDPMVKSRLEELVIIVRDRMTTPAGAMHLIFKLDFSPAPTAQGRLMTSHGHNIETAYLLIGAMRAMGRPDDAVTWTIARQMVDNTLAKGFSNGVLGEGPIDGKASAETARTWWAAAEAANTLLLMHEKYGRATDMYRIAFEQQFAVIEKHFVDPEFGGWHEELNADLSPNADKPLKHHDQKAADQTVRSMLNIADRARSLARSN